MDDIPMPREELEVLLDILENFDFDSLIGIDDKEDYKDERNDIFEERNNRNPL